jgi:glycosyltransferase involved in cell wall biosynthesis
MARLLQRESRCIYNAIDLDRFQSPEARDIRERKRQELRLSATEPVALTIGRLTLQKGYSILLQAATQVLAEIPSFRFLIVGVGELEEELKRMARQLGIEHAVIFTGPRPDVEGLLAAVDLFVSSSRWEGLPTVILESMAARVPVVATDVSGTRELVQDGVTGLLVPPGDPHSLSHAIVRMFREREQATAMAERAYCRVQDFSIARVTEQHMEVYLQLLAHVPELRE